jgi:hypothetical protein
MPNGKQRSKNQFARQASKSGNTKSEFKKDLKDATRRKPEHQPQNLNLKIGIEIECLPVYEGRTKDQSEDEREKRYRSLEKDMQKILKDDRTIKAYEQGSQEIEKHEIWVIKYDPSLVGKSHHSK